MGSPGKTVLAILAAPYALLMIVVGALYAIDPLDLRPWSASSPILDERGYPLQIRPLLLPAQLDRGGEVILAGTSTGLRVSGETLGRLSPGGSGLNIAQASLTAEATEQLFAEAARAPRLKRLVLEIGEYWRRENLERNPFGNRVVQALAPQWWELPGFDAEMIEAYVNQQRGGSFYIPDWSHEAGLLVPGPENELLPFQLAAVENARKLSDRSGYASDTAGFTCASFGRLLTSLEDAYRTAATRGVRVDVVFTPIPYSAMPLYWQQIGAERDHAQLLDMHRCVVDQAALPGNEHVTIHAINTDEQLVGDMRGMIDAFHYGAPAKLERYVDLIESGETALTPANFGSYVSRLQRGILDALDRPVVGGKAGTPGRTRTGTS